MKIELFICLIRINNCASLVGISIGRKGSEGPWEGRPAMCWSCSLSCR